MTPLGIKDFGIDSLTGLTKQMQIWQITIDSKAEKIVIIYDIVLLSPTGIIVQTILTDSYERYNDIDNNKLRFDALKVSTTGQEILDLIATDIAKIGSYETLKNDLTQ